MADAIKVPRATPLEYRIYDCELDVEVDDLVYLVDDTLVGKAQSNDLNKVAIGFCVKKKSDTSCVVSDEKVITGSFILNKNYFLSDIDEGQIRLDTPTDPNTFVQCVGFAESATKLIGRVDRKILIRK
jgi:hypothetical protein